MTDKEIKDGIIRGDLDTFRYLYDTYFILLKNYILLFVKEPEIAEEIVQETFINIWEYHERVIINTSVKSYLYKSVYNRAINYFKSKYSKKRSQTKSLDDEDFHFEMASHRFKSEIVDKLISDELEDYINQQIAELPPQCQKAFSLSRKEHLSNKEIAQEMGISVSTVKTYIARSLDKIREALKNF